MSNLRCWKFICLSIIVFGASLFVLPSVYAGDANYDGGVDEYEESEVVTMDEEVSEDAMDAVALNSEMVFTPVTPCRIIDTREAGGKILGGTARSFHVYGSGSVLATQGGNPAGCVTNTATTAWAVVLNITAVQSDASGYLTVWPYGEAMPLAAVVNYNPTDKTDPIANAFIVKFNPVTSYDISVYTKSSVNIVADVMGFFSSQSGSQLPGLHDVTSSSVSVPASSQSGVITTSCPENYVALSGGYNCSSACAPMRDHSTDEGRAWSVNVLNLNNYAINVWGHAMCVKASSHEY